MPPITLLILFFLANNWSKQEKWSQVFSLTQKHEQFQIDESTKKIRLNAVPIIQETEQILLDNQVLVLVLSTVPKDPFFDYGLDVLIGPLGYSEPFWIEKRRLFPLPSDLLP